MIMKMKKKNYTVCNICNQNLLCKHWLFGVKQLETNGEIDMNEMINIYGIESNDVYNCKSDAPHFIFS